MQSTGSILVVDPEPTSSDLLVKILTGEGYFAYTVPNGRGVLGASACNPRTLILLAYVPQNG